MTHPALADRGILFINNFPGPGMGGGEVQVLSIMRGCVEAGMRVHLACVPGSALGVAAAAAGVTVHDVPMSLAKARAATSALRDIAVSQNLEIVQGSGYFTNILARLTAPGTSARVVNLVQTMPGAAAHDGGSRSALTLRRMADRATRRRADFVVAVSSAVARDLASHGYDDGVVRVIPNGIDIDAVVSAADHPPPPGVPPGGPLVVCVARLEPVKGVEDFVRAAALLSHERPDVRFALAGAGSLEGHLRTVAVAQRLTDALTFLGHVSAPPLLRVATLVVLPSRSEGLPIAPMEAMALGRPVVATAVGGTPEVVENGVTGILVPPGDVTALAGAMLALVGDPDRARVLGEAGERRVRERFSGTIMVEAWLTFYDEVLRTA